MAARAPRRESTGQAGGQRGAGGYGEPISADPTTAMGRPGPEGGPAGGAAGATPRTAAPGSDRAGVSNEALEPRAGRPPARRGSRAGMTRPRPRTPDPRRGEGQTERRHQPVSRRAGIERRVQAHAWFTLDQPSELAQARRRGRVSRLAARQTSAADRTRTSACAGVELAHLASDVEDIADPEGRLDDADVLVQAHQAGTAVVAQRQAWSIQLVESASDANAHVSEVPRCGQARGEHRSPSPRGIGRDEPLRLDAIAPSWPPPSEVDLRPQLDVARGSGRDGETLIGRTRMRAPHDTADRCASDPPRAGRH